MKFKLTSETKEVNWIKLYRIEATMPFGNVSKWEKGWWIERENNLSQDGNAWVYDKIKLKFGWCFARKGKDWNVSEIENEWVILLIKDYKPVEEKIVQKLTVKEICDKLGYEVEIVK